MDYQKLKEGQSAGERSAEETKCREEEGLDLCLGDIIVKGLGLRNDQYEASMREIYERVSSLRERERFFPGREPTSCVLVLMFLAPV